MITQSHAAYFDEQKKVIDTDLLKINNTEKRDHILEAKKLYEGCDSNFTDVRQSIVSLVISGVIYLLLVIILEKYREKRLRKCELKEELKPE